MGVKETVLYADARARLVEIRHNMPRGLTVTRYRLNATGEDGSNEFTTLRKARAAFRALVDEPPHRRADGSDGP